MSSYITQYSCGQLFVQTITLNPDSDLLHSHIWFHILYPHFHGRLLCIMADGSLRCGHPRFSIFKLIIVTRKASKINVNFISFLTWPFCMYNFQRHLNMSRRMKNQQKAFRPVWSESSLSAWRKLRSLATHWAHSEDSDRNGLIWVFAGRTCHFVGFVMRQPMCSSVRFFTLNFLIFS